MLPLFLCSFPKFLSWRTRKVTLHIPGHMWKCYLFIYTKEQSLFEKVTGFQRVKKFPAFYGTRGFIAAFTSASHMSLSWARSIQSKAPPPILFPEDSSSYYRPIYAWVFQVVSFHQVSPPNSAYFLCTHTCYMTRQSHSSRFVHPNNTWWGVQIISS